MYSNLSELVTRPGEVCFTNEFHLGSASRDPVLPLVKTVMFSVSRPGWGSVMRRTKSDEDK
jgi:hypothetical protein